MRGRRRKWVGGRQAGAGAGRRGRGSIFPEPRLRSGVNLSFRVNYVGPGSRGGPDRRLSKIGSERLGSRNPITCTCTRSVSRCVPCKCSISFVMIYGYDHLSSLRARARNIDYNKRRARNKTDRQTDADDDGTRAWIQRKPRKLSKIDLDGVT